MADEAADIIDWAYFEKSRTEMGPGFIRILSYFKEDGTKSIAQIEQAMRAENTIALVMPAHTLKGEARQLGDELVPEVVALRRLFNDTIDQFDKATNPLMTRAAPVAGFGRKVGNQDFGRI